MDFLCLLHPNMNVDAVFFFFLGVNASHPSIKFEVTFLVLFISLLKCLKFMEMYKRESLN